MKKFFGNFVKDKKAWKKELEILNEEI